MMVADDRPGNPVQSRSKSRFGLSGVLGLLLLSGCVTNSGVPCPQDTAARDAKMDREHASRVEQAVPEPDKGPSPEGIEAIALLEQRMLEGHGRDCTPPK